jgi:hypothetical protein
MMGHAMPRNDKILRSSRNQDTKAQTHSLCICGCLASGNSKIRQGLAKCQPFQDFMKFAHGGIMAIMGKCTFGHKNAKLTTAAHLLSYCGNI